MADANAPEARARKPRREFGCIERRKAEKDGCQREGYYVSFTAPGGRRFRRYGGGTRAIAAGKLAAAHALIERGCSVEQVLAEVFGDVTGARLTFRDACPLYLEHAKPRKKPSTYEGDVCRLRVLSAAPWAGEYLGAIRPEAVTRWAHERVTKEGVSGATVNRDLALGSALFRWAERMGYVEGNPFRKVEKFSEKGREKETYLTGAECRALLAAADPWLRPVLAVALSTGTRRGEIVRLLWRDVDFARGEINIRAEVEKAGRGRAVPMTPDLRATLEALRDAYKVRRLDGADPVFNAPNGGPLMPWHLRRGLAGALARCKDDDIPKDKRAKIGFHTLRHTGASLMVQAGVPLYEVGRILGHSSPVVTQRYAHLAPESGRAAVERLGKALGLGAILTETAGGA